MAATDFPFGANLIKGDSMAKKASGKGKAVKAESKEDKELARRVAILKAAKSATSFNSLLSKLPNENEAFIRCSASRQVRHSSS